MVKFYLLFLFILCLYFSIGDLINRTIDNEFVLVLIALQFSFAFIEGDIFLLSFLIQLSIGMVFYSLSWFGAGDSKYSAVLSLSLPVELLPNALLLTMLTGGVVSVFCLLLNIARRIKFNVYGGVDDSQYNAGIPYGVAISVGFYVMIFSHWVNYI
ncbi:prepilin peptidase [Vibrio splendidus]|uniref:A24 family peptidase n=1 Tax=Vibrio splendidus TaxID=29497 RepID=UPI00352DC89B